MSKYANKKMQEATVEKHELLGQKTQKQRKIDDLAETGQRVAKSRHRQAMSDMADLQKTKVNIDERIKQIEAKIKNPEKLRLSLEKFSNLSFPLVTLLVSRVGLANDLNSKMKGVRLAFSSFEVRLMDERERKNAEMAPFNSNFGEPRDLNLEPILDELRELHRILYVPSTCNSDTYFKKLPH